jgi:aspartyl-tRNA(Asn)/glutamyl-tRNA(Gln) amidotransferase subunit B
MRSKEEAHDYRYFPDPDLLPLVLTADMIAQISKTVPELPLDKFRRYQENFGLSHYDAEILTSDRALADFFESAIAIHNNPKSIANWVINEVLRANKNLNDSEVEAGEFNTNISAVAIAELVKLIDEKIISNTIAKQVLAAVALNPEKSPMQVVEEKQLRVVSNDSEIDAFVMKVLEDNPGEVEKFRAGKTQVLGFLMGQLMKLAKGKVAPERANQLLSERLNKHS